MLYGGLSLSRDPIDHIYWATFKKDMIGLQNWYDIFKAHFFISKKNGWGWPAQLSSLNMIIRVPSQLFPTILGKYVISHHSINWSNNQSHTPCLDIQDKFLYLIDSNHDSNLRCERHRITAIFKSFPCLFLLCPGTKCQKAASSLLLLNKSLGLEWQNMHFLFFSSAIHNTLIEVSFKKGAGDSQVINTSLEA